MVGPRTQEQEAEARVEEAIVSRRLNVFAGSSRCPREYVRPFPPDPAVASSDTVAAARDPAIGTPDASRCLFPEDDSPQQPGRWKPGGMAGSVLCRSVSTLRTAACVAWSVVSEFLVWSWSGGTFLDCAPCTFLWALLCRCGASRCGALLVVATCFALYQSEASLARLTDNLRLLVSVHVFLAVPTLWGSYRLLPVEHAGKVRRLGRKLLGLALWFGLLAASLWWIWACLRCHLLWYLPSWKAWLFGHSSGNVAKSVTAEWFGEGWTSSLVGWTTGALAGWAGVQLWPQELDPSCDYDTTPREEDKSFLTRGLRYFDWMLGTAELGQQEPNSSLVATDISTMSSAPTMSGPQAVAQGADYNSTRTTTGPQRFAEGVPHPVSHPQPQEDLEGKVAVEHSADPTSTSSLQTANTAHFGGYAVFGQHCILA